MTAACGADDLLEGWLEGPTTDGPFEIEVSTAEGLDSGLVRVGLFDIDDGGETVDQDGAVVSAEASIDILASAEGKAKLIDRGRDDVSTALFRPIEALRLDGHSRVVVDLPEVGDDDERGFRLIVWYDSDGDGALTLSSMEGQSEFARAPSRRFPESDDLTMSLHSIDSVDPEHRAETGGRFIASAYTRVDSDDDEDPEYERNDIADRELTGWNASLAAPSM